MSRVVAAVGVGAAIVLAAAGGFLVGRGHPAQDASELKDATPVVARVGDHEIAASELKARLEAFGPMARARLSTLEGRRQVLDELIRTELLAAAAREEGYAKDPKVQHLLNEALAEVYLERELEPLRSAVTVSDTLVRARFEKERARYASPARVRVAEIFLSAPVEPAAERAARHREAEALLAQLKAALTTDFHAFGALARAHSDEPASRSNGGELHPMTMAELTEALGEEAAKRAFDEPQPGALLPEVFASPAGFHLVRVLEHHPAAEPDLEQMKETLRARLKGEQQQRVYDDFIAALQTRMPVQVDEDVLSEVGP